MNKALSVAQIAGGMDAARRNAADLIADADTLSATRRSRAYALTHTACEELAKFFILSMAARRLILGHKIDWRRFWSRYRSHDSKGAQVDLQVALSMGLAGDSIEPVSFSLSVRNASLYSDLGPDQVFRSPSDIDWTTPTKHSRAVAETLLARAGRYGYSVGEIEKELRSPSDVAEVEKVRMILESAVRSARDSGRSKEDLHKIIRKVFGDPKEPTET